MLLKNLIELVFKRATYMHDHYGLLDLDLKRTVLSTEI